MTTIPLITTAAHSCSYLENKSASTAFVHPNFEMSNDVYQQLITRGFRRSGRDVYKPACRSCAACIPARVPVSSFKATRNQNRCINKNQSIQTSLLPPLFKQEHYDLYLKYQRNKHPESSMQHTSAEEFIHFLSCDWSDTLFVEFTLNGQLFAVAVIDIFSNALSAVYTFFDPLFMKHSPGMFAVLWQIHYAKQLELDWVYLGYWIAECKKMSYKNQYQPLEIYQHEQWLRIEKPELNSN